MSASPHDDPATADTAIAHGWHDSSWELKRGLDVIEGPPSAFDPPGPSPAIE